MTKEKMKIDYNLFFELQKALHENGVLNITNRYSDNDGYQVFPEVYIYQDKQTSRIFYDFKWVFDLDRYTKASQIAKEFNLGLTAFFCETDFTIVSEMEFHSLRANEIQESRLSTEARKTHFPWVETKDGNAIDEEIRINAAKDMISKSCSSDESPFIAIGYKTSKVKNPLLVIN